MYVEWASAPYKTLSLDSKELIGEEYGAYHEGEVYFEAPELSEGIDYMISYGGDDMEEESKA